MLGNDIDNTPSPLLYVVWEGLIATCGEMDRALKLIRLRRYKKALGLFHVHYVAVDAMWQVMHHRSYGVSVLTHLPKGFAELLPEWLDMNVVPYRDIVALSPGDLVNQMPHMPWLLGVADPEQYRARAYGSFGKHVPPEHAEMIGVLY